MWRFLLATVIALGVLAMVQGPKNTDDFVWGINGHPLTQADYRHNWTEQLNEIKKLHLNMYRFDVLLNADGISKNSSLLINLLEKLVKSNIKPLPAVMLNGFKNVPADNIYSLAFKQGQTFAKKYSQYINVIEVGNEGDDKLIKSPNLDGTKLAHYDKDKAVRLISATRGFIDGLKSVKPQIKVTLSFSWVHFYYLQMLEDNKVNYDIIGYHWYSNMGDMTNVRKPFGNVLAGVYKRYKKPIWITEFNYFKGTTRVDFKRQREYIENSLRGIMAQNIIGGFFVYELYDQPSLAIKRPDEASYGLLYRDSSGNYVPKDAYKGFQKLIAQYSRSSF